jgi:hypothetical protein
MLTDRSGRNSDDLGQREKGKWKENLPPWIYEAWHFILSRELGLPHQRGPSSRCICTATFCSGFI